MKIEKPVGGHIKYKPKTKQKLWNMIRIMKRSNMRMEDMVAVLREAGLKAANGKIITSTTVGNAWQLVKKYDFKKAMLTREILLAALPKKVSYERLEALTEISYDINYAHPKGINKVVFLKGELVVCLNGGAEFRNVLVT